MAAGAAIEMSRNVITISLSVFIKNVKPSIHAFLIENIKEITTLEQAITLASRFEAGQSTREMKISAMEMGFPETRSEAEIASMETEEEKE